MKKKIKKYAVESRYKNPDAYVANLKSEINLLKYQREITSADRKVVETELEELRFNLLGEHWFNFADGVTKGVDFNNTYSSKKAEIGDTVFLKAKVIKLVHSKVPKESEAVFGFKEVFLKK